MEGMKGSSELIGVGTTAQSPPDTAALGYRDAAPWGARQRLRARREEPNRGKKPRFTEGFLPSLSLEGKPRKKQHLEKKTLTNMIFQYFLSTAEQSGGARVLQPPGRGCGGGAASTGGFCHGFSPPQLTSFEFPQANSTSDRERGGCTSPRSSAEHPPPCPVRGTPHLCGDEDRDPTPALPHAPSWTCPIQTHAGLNLNTLLYLDTL